MNAGISTSRVLHNVYVTQVHQITPTHSWCDFDRASSL